MSTYETRIKNSLFYETIKKYLFFFLLTSFIISFYAPSNAQLLAINKPLFSDDPFFNTLFIKENKIKSIKGSRSSKKIQDIIRSKGLDFYYEFDNKGNLSKQIATFIIGKVGKDTNIITYEYNDNNHLILQRKSDNYGFYSHSYQLDSLNRIIKQTYNREENTYACKGSFMLCQRYPIASDSFSYQQIDSSQIKKIFYNNYGKPYKQQINYYDEFGYLTEEYTKFIIGNKKSKKTFEYDENGRLTNEHYTSYLSQEKKITQTFEYDNLGNVLSIKIFHDDKHITTKQFIYDQKTMLLTAQLIQDIPTEFIQIVQYQYTFFDNINSVH
ncbi:MAG: hypothetical protein J5I47_08335 [Vicingus serpentipes]|nr:hypothetical protein [Vicingus serpentipes]